MRKLATLIAFVPLLLLAAVPEAEPESWTVDGSVVAVASDGIFIACSDSNTRPKQPTPGEVVFVRGRFSFATGAVVNLTVEPIGQRPYKTADAAVQNVRAFEIRH